MSENPKKPLLPVTESCVPVFDCHVLVSTGDDGTVRVRTANLPNMTATGGTERDALLRIVADFKKHVAGLVEAGDSIQWIDPPIAPEANESERWIPVHL